MNVNITQYKYNVDFSFLDHRSQDCSIVNVAIMHYKYIADFSGLDQRAQTVVL